MSLTDRLPNLLGSGGEDTEPDAVATPEQDELYSVLSVARRRLAIATLYHEGEAVPIGDLAEAVASAEYGVPVAELDTKQRKRVYVSLYQTNVPALDDAGVVVYDGRDEVAPGPRLGLYFEAMAGVQETIEANGGGL